MLTKHWGFFFSISTNCTYAISSSICPNRSKRTKCVNWHFVRLMSILRLLCFLVDLKHEWSLSSLNMIMALGLSGHLTVSDLLLTFYESFSSLSLSIVQYFGSACKYRMFSRCCCWSLSFPLEKNAVLLESEC